MYLAINYIYYLNLKCIFKNAINVTLNQKLKVLYTFQIDLLLYICLLIRHKYWIIWYAKYGQMWNAKSSTRKSERGFPHRHASFWCECVNFNEYIIGRLTFKTILLLPQNVERGDIDLQIKLNLNDPNVDRP